MALRALLERLLVADDGDCTSGHDVVPCEAGIAECCSVPGLPECALYNGVYRLPGQLTWVLVVAFIVTALMAYGIGANDAANSWGTSVGSGACTLTQAVLTGGLMDWLGATTLGAGVSDTIRKGIADTTRHDCWACGYCDSRMSVYMLGMVCALLATAVFLLLSSVTSMPVSTTHAIVGAVVGMTMVGAGTSCLEWGSLAKIVASWFLSPLLSGVIGVGMYASLHKSVILAPDAEQAALRACPWLFSLSTFCLSALILLKSNLTKDIGGVWVAAISLAVFVSTWVISHYFMVPHIWQRILSAKVTQAAELEMGETSAANGDPSTVYTIDDEPGPADEDDDGMQPALTSLEVGTSATAKPQDEPLEDEWGAVLDGGPQPAAPGAPPGVQANEDYNDSQQHALFVFRYLLVFVAALESFAHGANDTGNATGAFSAVWMTYQNGLDSCDLQSTPTWVMLMGGFFVFLGVFTLGHRVIRTMGFGLANINFLRGFCIEFASTASVVLATILKLPVSTTHCQVGAVVFVGWYAFGARHVQWSLMGWIGLTWLVTLPSAGAGAAALLAALRPAIKS